MKTFKLKRTTLAFLGVAFVAIGTYNSLVVNSDSFMDSQSVRFVKRLDELNGDFTAGRMVANHGAWIKLRSPKKSALKSPVARDVVTVSNAAPTNEQAPVEVANAAIKDELSLELVEVFNAKKYQAAPKVGEFSGSMSTKDGVIESLSISLPKNESLSISFSEMAGNVFEYEYEGQELSGMMYQMDKTSYMVTLTNGPFEGTRLKFNAPQAVDENVGGNNSEQIAENNVEKQAEEAAPEFASVVNDDGSQTEVGSFGAEPMQQPEQSDVAQNDNSGYGFNFEQNAATF